MYPTDPWTLGTAATLALWMAATLARVIVS